MKGLILASRAKSLTKIILIVVDYTKRPITRQMNENWIHEVIHLLVQLHINLLEELK